MKLKAFFVKHWKLYCLGRFMGLREGEECIVQAVPTQKRIWNKEVIKPQFRDIFCLVKLEFFFFDLVPTFKNQEIPYQILDFWLLRRLGSTRPAISHLNRLPELGTEPQPHPVSLTYVDCLTLEGGRVCLCTCNIIFHFPTQNTWERN